MSADPDVVGSESVGLHARWQLPSEALDGGVGVSAPPRHILKVRFTVTFRVWPCRRTRTIRETSARGSSDQPGVPVLAAVPSLVGIQLLAHLQAKVLHPLQRLAHLHGLHHPV